MPRTESKESLIELVIPNKPEFLRVVRLLVSGYVSRWPLSFDEVENVKVAVTEACNNAIQYAYDEGIERQLKIRCWNKKSKLFFEVSDKGRGMGLPDGDALEPESVDDEMGLGFLLIRTLMDDVKVRTKPNHGTTVTMTKSLTIN